jgi:hypothetical protein
MNHKPGALGILPTFSVIVLATGLMNHVIVIPPLLQEAKRDAWLSIALTLLPYLLWVSLLHTIMKRTGQQPIIPWLKQHYGSAVAGGFRAFFSIYLFIGNGKSGRNRAG